MTEKMALRARVRAGRAARASRHPDAFARTLSEMTLTAGARTVACFIGVGREPDTSEFLAWSETVGVRVLLPRSLDDGELEWAEHTGEFRPGLFGIPEPVGAGVPSAMLRDVDLCFVPAAAVDVRGTRLGWGRGFYDRALAAMPERPAAYAVVFEDEVLDLVPAEEHDVAVLGAITEQTLHTFG